MSVPAYTAPDETSTLATCAFAVHLAASGPGPFPPALSGHAGGGEPRVLDAGELALIVQSVPAAAFAGEALAERLQDPAELERCARAHHDVITAAARTGPVVPLPLATLYLDDTRAVAAVREREAQFTRLLNRLHRRTEWGLKVTSTPGAQPPADRPAGETDRRRSPADGRAYLDRVRGRQRDREHRHEAAWRAAERVYAVARRTAVEARRLRPQDPALAGAGARQLLNAALLLDHGTEARLRHAIDQLSTDPAIADQARIELTGPWVPYSFARLDEEAATDGLQ
ncbi:GvpL/GvpF family gas vesicle protein [Streptomyces otsuchiensis]|uniref:GvpL/GvpF family gas vesicle protein n=1 Tax=Streptomyces otsuchiensis TaxID=2681388 RepID=UPI0010324F76|nr:GvpL/GvpF family gas vesicle protein [Streptomyces otsuchiensis]